MRNKPCCSSICKRLITNTLKIIIKIKNRYIGYFLEVDVPCTEKFHDLSNDFPFLPERIKTEKVEKHLKNLEDKEENAIHIRNLKQVLNHGLIFKKVHKDIKYNQKAWLKSQIDMSTEIRKKLKTILKTFFQVNE